MPMLQGQMPDAVSQARRQPRMQDPDCQVCFTGRGWSLTWVCGGEDCPADHRGLVAAFRRYGGLVPGRVARVNVSLSAREEEALCPGARQPASSTRSTCERGSPGMAGHSFPARDGPGRAVAGQRPAPQSEGSTSDDGRPPESGSVTRRGPRAGVRRRARKEPPARRRIQDRQRRRSSHDQARRQSDS